MNFNKQMQKIIRRFEKETRKSSYSAKEVARWAIEKDEWAVQPEMLIKRCAEDVARALREEYVTDSQGRRARTKHVALIKEGGIQQSIWSDCRTASRSHMELSLQQRRKGIVGDCKQLKTDVDSYNDNYNDGEQIIIVFDFNADLVEAEIGNSKKKISANEPRPLSRQFSDVVQ